MTAALDACRYSLFAVAEIHRLGFNKIRAMPYWENHSWNLLIGDESAFDISFGAYVPPQNRRQCIRLEPTRNRNFMVTRDSEPWEIANKLISHFPRNFDKPAVGENAYTNWFKSLVIHLSVHPSTVPTVSADGSYSTVWIAQLLFESTTPLKPIARFISPPEGIYDARVDQNIDSDIRIAQPRPTDAPSLIWPIIRNADSRLDNWYDNNGPGELKEVRW